MIPPSAVVRIARPTDNLETVTLMYMNGLGLQLLGEFDDHDGFNGRILGHAHHPWHLEFTHHGGSSVGRAPTQDNLLVFYLPDKMEWETCCRTMIGAGFQRVTSFNPYWEIEGVTFEDCDGYRVVLQNRSWKI
jgi:hypothetical protein